MYDTDVAEIWDTVYRGRGRDYPAETAGIAALVRAHNPDAASLLDVACGTGEQVRLFAAWFPEVAGVDLSEQMLAVGRQRWPGADLSRGDMRTLSLPGRRFDAITCMFSSVGHLRDTGELDATLLRFAAHLNPGGVVVVEPWWFPATFLDGYVSAAVIEDGDQSIARVSHSVVEGDRSRITAHFVVAGAGRGVRHFVEDFPLSLFTREQYEAAFDRAGLDVAHQDTGPAGRGLFVGTAR